ncbi:hypothetical protein ACFCXT_23255 [Streptomyces vinaceus]|uniref:hypothetical protein n=1 Tax=Streptomyces vinaceus TaxID=1960 RepID=UPI0035E02164
MQILKREGRPDMQWEKYPEILCCISSRTGTQPPADIAGIFDYCSEVLGPDLLIEQREGGLPTLISELKDEYGVPADSDPPHEFISYLWMILTAEYDGGYVFTLTEDGSKWLATTPDTPLSSWVPYVGDFDHNSAVEPAAISAPDSFFPDLEAAAWRSLSVIGAAHGENNCDVLVVPDEFNLSGSNPAIAIKATLQVQTYRLAVDAVADTAEWFGKVDSHAIQRRVHINTILVKKSTAEKAGNMLDGILWHEWGHITLDASESGRVFAHELAQILEHKGEKVALEWYASRPPGYYARTAVSPGIDELSEVVAKFLPQDKLHEFNDLAGTTAQNRNTRRGKRMAAIHEEPKTEIPVGGRIKGTLPELKQKIGRTATSAKFMATGPVLVHSQIKFADIRWIVISIEKTPNNEDVYELERV